MKIYKVIENKEFIPREPEDARLKDFAGLSRAAIMIIYGRRRTGKTELIEQTFKSRHLLKFEGLEIQPQQEQIAQVLYLAAQFY